MKYAKAYKSKVAKPKKKVVRKKPKKKVVKKKY